MVAEAELKRFLVVSYEYSARIAGGSVRVVGFARHAPAFGWTASVVTATPAEDQPDICDINVITVPSVDGRFGGGIQATDDSGRLNPPGRLLRLLSPLKFWIPLERQALWLPRMLRQLGRQDTAGVRAVVVTSPPYVVLWAGRRLARRIGVPLIVDLRDDWVDRFAIEKRSVLNRALMHRFMNQMLRSAEAIVVVSPDTQDRLIKAGYTVHWIPNGFDEDEFVDIAIDAPLIGGDGPLTVVHTGWLGGFRSCRPVLDAMARIVREQGPRVDPVFRFKQMGLIDEHEIAVLAEVREGVDVVIEGQRSRTEAIKAMATADVLLVVPGTNIPAAVTGKIFEYYRARRPILLVARTGAATRLASEIGLRYVCAPDDVDGIVSTLRELLVEKRNGTLRTRSSTGGLERWERTNGARALADVLDSVAGSDGSAAT